MRKLILIKHAAPQIVPDIPAHRWRLSAAGRARCSSLAQQIATYSPAHIVASLEPKASETAHLVSVALGVPWSGMDGLHEHDRSTTPYVGHAEFNAAVARFFAEPATLVFGGETADAARERFDSAIAAVLRQYPQGNLAVVAHGTVITLFVAQANQVDAFALWQRLDLPSYVVLALPDFQLLELMETIED